MSDEEPSRDPKKRRGPADSILLGALSLILAWGSLGLALSARRGEAPNELFMSAAAVGCCSGPLFAAMNLVFVMRDRQAGRSAAALVGLTLSALSILATLISLGLAD